MKLTPGLYRAVTMVALPLASLYLTWRSRKQPAYREFWDERFAWSTYPLRGERPRVWIHAVSVGETNAAKPLLERMLADWPECDVLLTHMTPTGREAGEKLVALAPERIHQCYLPYDAPYAVEKFFRQTRPTLGVIMETEVWPNVMHEASRLGIPMVLASTIAGMDLPAMLSGRARDRRHGPRFRAFFGGARSERRRSRSPRFTRRDSHHRDWEHQV